MTRKNKTLSVQFLELEKHALEYEAIKIKGITPSEFVRNTMFDAISFEAREKAKEYLLKKATQP